MNKMSVIFLSLGSNVGDREANLRGAIELLKESISELSVAPFYNTKPVGVEDQADFLNTAVGGFTAMGPDELLVFVKNIEKKLGRTERMRWGPREIDVDIVFYDDLVYVVDDLVVPHPRAHEREFVLRPLADLEPEFSHPILKKTVRELLAELGAN